VGEGGSPFFCLWAKNIPKKLKGGLGTNIILENGDNSLPKVKKQNNMILKIN